MQLRRFAFKNHSLIIQFTDLKENTAGTATLWQRCHNVVDDVVTTLRSEMRVVPTSVSDVATTSLSDVVKLSSRYHNVAATSPHH